MYNLLKTSLVAIILFFGLTVFSQVTVDFKFDKSEGCGSLPVSFTDLSKTTSGNIVEWSWDLGGLFSSKQNPGIIFTNPGEYTICLTVKTSTGETGKICKDKIIKIYQNPIADFSVDITEGCSPVVVIFKNAATSKNGNITSLLWGVGGSANLVNSTDPSQLISTTYSSQGNYSATLSVVDEKGCKSTITKPNIISVTSPPRVQLDYEYLSSCNLPWDVRFANLDVDPSATYTWDFGNGQSFTGSVPPIVKYTDPKDYTVKVIVKKGPCLDTVVFKDIIKTNRITDFEILAGAKCVNQEIIISDISNYTSDSLVWEFGDGTTSKGANPQHIYTKPGCYTIKLKKYVGSCIQEVVKPCINILPAPKVDIVIDNGYSCLIPAPVNLLSSADIIGDFSWSVKGPALDTIMSGNKHDLLITKYGQYSVKLVFTGQNGCILTREDQNMDITKFEAALPAFGPKGCIPFSAALTDSIVANVPLASWYWEVGSPAIFTSTLRNPVFPVSDTGRWDVKLIVQNIYGCKDTIVKQDYIQGGTRPVIDFTADPLNDCLKIQRNFQSLTSANADFWIWTFNGSNFFSNAENPKYIFDDFGVFDITLTAFHNGCGNQLTKEDFITVYKPISKFEVKYKCDDPLTIDITNQSLGADSLYWVVQLSPTVTDTIRDSLLSSYTFPDRGTYFLTHYSKSFETGCDHVKTDSIFIVDLEASYTLDTIRGCAPLDVKVSSTIQDAVMTEFLPGQYTIINPGGNDVTVTFTEGGILLGPKLVVTDRHGCKDTFQTSTPVEVSKIDATILCPDVICIPGTEKVSDISSLGLGTITEREWYFSSNDQRAQTVDAEFSVSNPGPYFLTLKLKDSWGCSDSVRKDVLAVTLIPSFTSDTLSCTDKAIRFVVDADPTFLNAFEWTFGDGQSSTEKNPLHNFASEGTFDVCAELFDSRGCSKKICKPKQVTIKNPVANFLANPTAAPCPPLLTNFFNLSTNANNFTWNFGDNSGLSYNEKPSNLYTNPGLFDVTLFAEMIPGCVDTLVIPEMVEVKGPKATVGFQLAGNCVPLQIQLNGVSDKLYEYIWDFGDGQIEIVAGLNMVDTTNYVYDKPGMFVPKLLVSDDNGCSRTFTIDPIEVNEVKPEFLTDNKPWCGLPSLITLENKTTSSASEINYEWTFSGVKEFKNLDETPMVIIDQYGKYSITLIASTVNCIDTIHVDSLLEVAAIPMPDFDFVSQQQCQNVALEINNKTSLDYGAITDWLWDFGNGQKSVQKDPSIVFNATGRQNVKLSVMTDKGCRNEIIKDINILPNTLLSLPEDKTICIGDSIDISVNIISNTPYSIRWDSTHNFGCPTCETVNVKPSQTTTYYVYTTAASGCSNQDSLKVTVIPVVGPQLYLSSDTIVCENGFVDINIINYDSNYNYAWDVNDKGLDCYQNCSKVKASPKIDTYYSIVVTNQYGCFKEDSVLVTVERNIEDFLLPARTICEGGNAIIFSTGGNNPTWDYHPALSCTQCDSTTVTPAVPSLYWLTVTSTAGCKYRDSVYVDIVPLNSIDAGNTALICKGEVIKLLGKGRGDALWSSVYDIQNKNNLEATSSPVASATYYLTTTVDQCTLLDSVFISVIEKTTIGATGDTICPDKEALLTANGDATKYVWYLGKKSVDQGDSILVYPDKTVDYMVIGSRGLCKSDTAIVTAYVHPRIDYKQNEDSYEIFLNSKVELDATFDEEAPYLYEWTPSLGLDCTTCPEPEVQNINESTRYILNVTDINQCTLEQRVFVKFIDKCSGEGFYIPNIFTPFNRDGLNDLFKVYAEEAAEFISIVIYDRWGEKVYLSENVDEVWDGSYKGQQLTQGVFTYIVTARCDKTNDVFSFTGDVTIIE